MKKILFTIATSLLLNAAFAQIREIPKAVKDNFTYQYKNATNVDYQDQLTGVQVHFTQDSAQMIARYNNKGVWKETEKTVDYETLSSDVKEGFRKSKYATWKRTAAAIIYLPGNVEQYRVKVEKSDLNKRYLYFDKTGRLLKDGITI